MSDTAGAVLLIGASGVVIWQWFQMRINKNFDERLRRLERRVKGDGHAD